MAATHRRDVLHNKGSSRALMLDVEHAPPAFREALQVLRKGEKAILWVPPGVSTQETLVYEVEVVDVISPPKAVPP